MPCITRATARGVNLVPELLCRKTYSDKGSINYSRQIKLSLKTISQRTKLSLTLISARRNGLHKHTMVISKLKQENKALLCFLKSIWLKASY